MQPPKTWVIREFDYKPDVRLFPNIVERLRGTPGRIEEIVRNIPADKIVRKLDDKWSIQEHAGHYSEVEDLWLGRLGDFAAGLKELRPADMSNKRTYDADYNSVPLERILAVFREKRARLVAQLDFMTEADAGRSALHPRLQKPMRLIDLCFFAAEHDDHHLAWMSYLRGI